MSNFIAHYTIGLAIAHFLGFKGKNKFFWALLGVLPDADFIVGGIAAVIGLFTGVHYNIFNPTGIVFLDHRGFLHSLLFYALMILFLLWKRPDKNIKKLAIFAVAMHLLMDYFSGYAVHLFTPFWDAGITLLIVKNNNLIQSILGSGIIMAVLAYELSNKKGKTVVNYLIYSLFALFVMQYLLGLTKVL